MMPWFPRDFLAATRGWSLVERAVYRELLDAQWEIGRLPMDADELARTISATRTEFDTGFSRCAGKFAKKNGGLVNERLEQHRRKASKLSKIRSKIGASGGKASARAKGAAIGAPTVNHPSPSEEEEKNSVRAAEPPSVDSLLFAEGRRVFGSSSGGLINKAIAQKGKPFVLEMIERCRNKDPEAARAYLVRAMTPQERRFQP